eukprot:1686457-Alexandrium_andersonii.AAC.1
MPPRPEVRRPPVQDAVMTVNTGAYTARRAPVLHAPDSMLRTVLVVCGCAVSLGHGVPVACAALA